MSKLKQKIVQLEKNIKQKNVIINSEYELLKNQVSVQHYIYLGVAGSFILGFLIARTKNRRQLAQKLTSFASKASRIYSGVKLFI